MEKIDINVEGQVLYVLKMAQMDENENLCYVIKFGYTKNFKKRYQQYKMYHQTVKILHLYPGGTVDDESKVKLYLKDYLYFGDEWYKYCPEVLEFFETNNTIEKLRQVTISCFKKSERKKIVADKYLLEYLYNLQKSENLTENVELYKSLEDELGQYYKEDHIKYVCFKYNLNEGDILNYIHQRYLDIDGIRKEIIDIAETFNSLPNTKDKLKLLVEFGDRKDIEEKDLSNLFQLIPDKYKEYYTVLGPNRIKANSYKEADLKKEWIKLSMPEEQNPGVDKKIYESFLVGSRYTKKDIKNRLKEIYQEEGYQRTAKAIDLEKYFGLKKIYITSSKENGFEILYKKDLVK